MLMKITTPASGKITFKQQMLLAREDAIIAAVNRLLAEKGFEAMTVDEVAANVGIAKASLYKHFSSKEDLAAAAMANAMKKAEQYIATLQPNADPLGNIREVVRWTMHLKLSGEMPSLPSQNSTLRAALMANKGYMDGLMNVSEILGSWIERSQEAGVINPQLPPIAVLYTLFARACDPVLEFLKFSNQHSDDEIVTLVMSTCFEGLNTR
jgi:TetR/AcrR family transcriptional regulator, regulator of autoinduction and epiphytic fitness